MSKAGRREWAGLAVIALPCMDSEFGEDIRRPPYGAAPHACSSAIRIVQRYDASAADAFVAWLDPEVARTWLFATASRPVARVEIDAREGGMFRFSDRIFGRPVIHVGRYVTIVRDRRLVFDLRMPDSHRTTRVSVELSSRENGCELALSHLDVPPERAEEVEARWMGILYGLGETLASLREDRRAKFAESACLSVEQGVA
jgi:uncharacterized protein YndB with AHSA1/START domain